MAYVQNSCFGHVKAHASIMHKHAACTLCFCWTYNTVERLDLKAYMNGKKRNNKHIGKKSAPWAVFADISRQLEEQAMWRSSWLTRYQTAQLSWSRDQRPATWHHMFHTVRLVAGGAFDPQRAQALCLLKMVRCCSTEQGGNIIWVSVNT